MPNRHGRDRLSPQDLAKQLAQQLAESKPPPPGFSLRDSVFVGRLLAGSAFLLTAGAVVVATLVGVNWWAERSAASTAEVLSLSQTSQPETAPLAPGTTEGAGRSPMIATLLGVPLTAGLGTGGPLPALPGPTTTSSTPAGSTVIPGGPTTTIAPGPSTSDPTTSTSLSTTTTTSLTAPAPTMPPPTTTTTASPTSTLATTTTTTSATTTTTIGVTTTTFPESTTTTCSGNSGGHGNGDNCG